MDEQSAVELAVKVIGLFGLYFVGISLGVLLHELGHALTALFATRQNVAIELGRGEKGQDFQIGRLIIKTKSLLPRYGVTLYDRSRETRARQTLVALCGPLMTAVVCAVCLWVLLSMAYGSWSWLVLLALCVANFRILIVAVWPIAYRPDGEKGEVWLSDALDIWRMWTRKGDDGAKERLDEDL